MNNLKGKIKQKEHMRHGSVFPPTKVYSSLVFDMNTIQLHLKHPFSTLCTVWFYIVCIYDSLVLPRRGWVPF